MSLKKKKNQRRQMLNYSQRRQINSITIINALKDDITVIRTFFKRSFV